MTLLIAGYIFSEEIEDFSRLLDDELDLTEKRENSTSPKRSKEKIGGLFFAADSTISSGSQTLLSGFRKIYQIPVRLWEPSFIGHEFGDFRGYNSIYQETEILIGFAGNTLTAQHCLNLITEHLTQLRISCKPMGNGPLEYTVLMHCQDNPLHIENGSWSTDTFTQADFKGLLDADKISIVILHSLNAAIKSAHKYKLDETSFKTLLTPFVAGIRCPSKNTYHLYEFLMSQVKVDGIWEVKIVKNEIPYDKVAVLGMGGYFDSQALSTYDDARQQGAQTETSVFSFLNNSIDQVKKSGKNGIDYPSVLKKFTDSGIEIRCKMGS